MIPTPIRTCVGCGAKQAQRAMLRIASHDGGMPVLDLTYHAVGRGAYLCRAGRCVERAWARRALERSLKLKQPAPAALKNEVIRMFEFAREPGIREGSVADG